MEPGLITPLSGLEHALHRYLDRSDGRAPRRIVQVLNEQGSLVGPEPSLPIEEQCRLYRWMLRVRVLDTRMVNLQRQGRIAFFVPSWGEEAAQIGTARALDPQDWVFPAYREQGVALFRGYPAGRFLCQILG
ncbi:MAG: thiamine pyrophosphate-dependent dehydrogenase E1 component subunit alpha, partial [Armatimonadetes bacterium]|nr:thiamine pyrophosphate-dependent dehydrogenase E1 component subunit alpha [Armatimonadota bacterium]